MKSLRIMIPTLALACLPWNPLQAALSPQDAGKLRNKFQTTTAPELPAQAAQVVGRASTGDQGEVAAAVIAAVGQNRPGSLPAVVASISSIAPATASLAAA